MSSLCCDGGVIYNSKLEGENYGWTRSSSILFWFSRSGCTCKNGKINKNFERKGNLGSGLQGRVIYCSKTLCNCRVAYKEDGTECFRRCLENDKGVVLSNSD